tara:strand:+ start:459 stop:671 length:213 start_codon:yes stop_codon:yes gene_type:complete
LDSLDKRIPVYNNNYDDLDIYAWNSNTDKPYRSEIGDTGGACICGNDQKDIWFLRYLRTNSNTIPCTVIQ